jgi:hypothetical protein
MAPSDGDVTRSLAYLFALRLAVNWSAVEYESRRERKRGRSYCTHRTNKAFWIPDAGRSECGWKCRHFMPAFHRHIVMPIEAHCNVDTGGQADWLLTYGHLSRLTGYLGCSFLYWPGHGTKGCRSSAQLQANWHLLLWCRGCLCFLHRMLQLPGGPFSKVRPAISF